MRALGFARFPNFENKSKDQPHPFFRISYVKNPHREIYTTFARDALGRDWVATRAVDLKPNGFKQIISRQEPVALEILNYELEHPGSILYYDPPAMRNGAQ